MKYPKAPLGVTFRRFVDYYLQEGGRTETFRGLNQTNLWEVMISVAVRNPDRLLSQLGDSLELVDGGIEAIPKALDWFEAYRAGETGFRFLSDYKAESLYGGTHRSATLAETLLYVAVTPQEQMGKKSYVALSKENLGCAPDRNRYAVIVTNLVQPEACLFPREAWSPSHRFLVVPKTFTTDVATR